MEQVMIPQQITLLHYPEIGSEQLLLFSTRFEERDEKGRLDTDLFTRRTQIMYLGKKGAFHRFQVFLLESVFTLSAKLDKYNLLMTRMSYVFDECFLEVNEKGVIEKVLNWEFFHYRWEIVKSKLLPDYEEEEFAPYFLEMEEILKDQKSLLAHLHGPSQYGLYFNGYWKVSEADSEERQEHLTFQPIWKGGSQLVTVGIEGKERTSETTILKGQFRYLDGFLYDGEKELKTETQHIFYSVKWVGLRKVLPE